MLSDVYPMNCRMILTMHHAVQRYLSASGMGKRTGFAWPNGMMAVIMPLQRVFAAKVTESLVQRQSGIAKTAEALVRFAS